MGGIATFGFGTSGGGSIIPVPSLITQNTVLSSVMLTGIGTTWDSATVFAVVGLNVAITAAVVQTNTTASLTLSAGATPGVAKITDDEGNSCWIIVQPAGTVTPSQPGMPWGLLNQVAIRRRPVQTTTALGDVIVAAYVDQPIQCTIQQYQRRGQGGEEDLPQGIVTRKVYSFYCNYYTDPTYATLTDILPTDRMVIVDGYVPFESRVEDLHDGAGRRNHIECKLVVSLPSGD
jgi:hypothetical protein